MWLSWYKIRREGEGFAGRAGALGIGVESGESAHGLCRGLLGQTFLDVCPPGQACGIRLSYAWHTLLYAASRVGVTYVFRSIPG